MKKALLTTLHIFYVSFLAKSKSQQLIVNCPNG